MNLHQFLGDTFYLFLKYVFSIFKELIQLTMHFNMREV
jgi:hypothetical protein